MRHFTQVTASQPAPDGTLAAYETAVGQPVYIVGDSEPDAPLGARSHFLCYGCGGVNPVADDTTTNRRANEHAAACRRLPLHGRPAYPRD